MKTTYQKPEIMTENVQLEGMLAQSPNARLNTSGSVDANSLDSKGNFWDEEDWEE